eukprot:TRINITY_DN6250_c0_g2_i3.p2 TRINITY_DN6250_c0_g2~~TRINITY_DN6250_c0_g2_i3.p2  ORF type:complete len:154 (+),score=51.37 TRINITY_DN6250_c0_g2_i3:283-744(+)
MTVTAQSEASAPPAPARDELNEAGYQAAAALKDNGRMGLFVRTLLESQGRVVADMDAFHAFLPQFSGLQGTKSFKDLVAELSHAAWAPPVAQAKERTPTQVEKQPAADTAAKLLVADDNVKAEAPATATTPTSPSEQKFVAPVPAQVSVPTQS